MKSIDLNVCVVDDDPAILDSLEMLLETAGSTVSTYPNGLSFLESDIRRFQGCVLLDVRMPEKDGLTVLSEALELNPNLYIIMMSGHGDIPMAVKALKKGAKDFIEKPFRGPVIVDAIDKARQRIVLNDREIRFVEQAKSRIALLTPRELEITEKLTEGKPNKIVAFELGISIRTVETHRAKILSKMQIRSLADLVKMHLAAIT